MQSLALFIFPSNLSNPVRLLLVPVIPMSPGSKPSGGVVKHSKEVHLPSILQRSQGSRVLSSPPTLLFLTQLHGVTLEELSCTVQGCVVTAAQHPCWTRFLPAWSQSWIPRLELFQLMLMCLAILAKALPSRLCVEPVTRLGSQHPGEFSLQAYRALRVTPFSKILSGFGGLILSLPNPNPKHCSISSPEFCLQRILWNGRQPFTR